MIHRWYARPVLFVADLNRLCADSVRRDKARLFIELTSEGLRDFQRELAERSVPNKATWWGYDSVQVDDPDGNELLFPTSE